MTDLHSTAASPPPRGVGTLRVHMLRVVAVAGVRTQTVMLEREPVALGRQGEVKSPLVLDDSEISRRHAVIEPGEDGRWVIVDQRSRNGTFVDGGRIERAELRHGSVIRIGRTLIVHIEAELRDDERLTAPADTRLVGGSVPALRLHAEIGLVAPKPLPVLVLGETGVGKELVARAVHTRSPHHRTAFVKVNCAAMPRELLESELFGHERGAFTGAHQRKPGRFEVADGGTIFLDEIGELHPALQAKLLHVLQDGEFSRVGGHHNLRVDVRTICATNRDLAREVAAGRFREDLFYRLNVINVLVPPLRDRRQEIPGLATYFVHRYARVFNVPERALNPETLDAFGAYPWPGNIRELENFIKRMIVLQDWNLARTLIAPAAGPATAATGPEPFVATRGLSLKEISRRAVLEAERDVIGRALEQCRWNRVKTAKMLKISYRALLYKIKDMGLKQDPAAS